MWEQVQDSDRNELPVEAVALMIGTQLERFSVDLEYFAVQSTAEEALESLVTPS